MTKKTYVITGGAGFIGSHIAEHLLKSGHAVRVVDNMLTGKQSNLDHLAALSADLTVYHTSITDLDALRPIFAGADVVFHEAALPSVPRSVADPLETHHHCVTGTLNVLIAARDSGVRRVVQAASSSAYGDAEAEHKTEDLLPAPKSPYGVAKLAGEYYAQAFYDSYGLETVNLRYFNVFGARQDPQSEYAAVIPKFITTMLDGRPPTIYGDGTQSRDFTYIDNVIHGNLLAAESQTASGHTINCATGGRVTLLDLVERINAHLNTSFEPIFEPERKGDILHSRAGTQKALDLLDFTPVVDFDTGLARTIAWYQAQREAAK
ncbi:MAG: SDR family oxidoreductase [Anaerolineaceae bacterium]|nr:MAG: SDR family oxidoreductase [Anaerolineaceae bacterium]